MNVELLQKVQAKIRETPTAFNMRDWVMNPDQARRSLDDEAREHFTDPPCNTVACIGGWARILYIHDRTQRPISVNLWFEVLSDLGPGSIEAVLEITMSEAERLFYTANWPHFFQKRYDAALAIGDFPLCAAIACDRIDTFIATDGAS